MVNLAIDIGNSRIKTAIYRSGQRLLEKTFDSGQFDGIKDMAYNQKVENIILSSTSHLPEDLVRSLVQDFYYLELTHTTPLPVTIDYATPHTLGKDRIAAAAGAHASFPGSNCLVIDAGTCITMDVILAGGRFTGGNISPGLQMRLKAMHQLTGRLPFVPFQNTDMRSSGFRWLGNSTEEAIRNGAQLGALLEVEGFIRICREEIKPLHILLTGGDADFFVKNLKTEIFALPNLVLDGLNQILIHNVEISEG